MVRVVSDGVERDRRVRPQAEFVVSGLGGGGVMKSVQGVSLSVLRENYNKLSPSTKTKFMEFIEVYYLVR